MNLNVERANVISNLEYNINFKRLGGINIWVMGDLQKELNCNY